MRHFTPDDPPRLGDVLAAADVTYRDHAFAESQFLADFNEVARRVSRGFPVYEAVANVSFDTFLRDVFAPELAAWQPVAFPAFELMASELVRGGNDFSNCSPQVFFA